MGSQAYLTLAAVVFCLGLFGTVTRRNTVGILLGIELMLNAVNINFVAFSRFTAPTRAWCSRCSPSASPWPRSRSAWRSSSCCSAMRRTATADHIDWLKG